MPAILGIDAAWSLNNGSGVALIAETSAGIWRTLAVASSYAEFLSIANLSVPSTIREIPAALVQASRQLAGTDLSMVVADIPLARTVITGRREADNLVSQKFGAQGCSTHTPPKTGLGPVSEGLRDGFAKAGFPLATLQFSIPCLVETYPHPALLALMQTDYRVKYKARAWKGMPASVAHEKRHEQFQLIALKLKGAIDGVSLTRPKERLTSTNLKLLEDQIDALVCAWVGIQILQAKAEPYGDENAAIWLPVNIPAKRTLAPLIDREAVEIA